MDLFIYGTLRDDALVEHLTGRRFAKRPALLTGYRRTECPETYPWIEMDSGAQVEGFILEGIDPESLARIDAYEQEGHLYRRTPVTVRVDTAQHHCMTYVGNPAALRAFKPE